MGSKFIAPNVMNPTLEMKIPNCQVQRAHERRTEDNHK